MGWNGLGGVKESAKSKVIAQKPKVNIPNFPEVVARTILLPIGFSGLTLESGIMETNLLPLEPLLLLLQAQSKDTIAQLLQALWKSRNSGLDAPQKTHFQDQLRLSSTAQLDQVLDCLVKLIRKSVYESLNQTEIQGLFPVDFHPRLQRLLAELLHKFQHEWREEAIKSQVSLPRLQAMSWETQSLDEASAEQRGTDKVGIVHLKVCDFAASRGEEHDVNFQVSRETLGAMLDSLYLVRDQLASITNSE